MQSNDTVPQNAERRKMASHLAASIKTVVRSDRFRRIATQVFLAVLAALIMGMLLPASITQVLAGLIGAVVGTLVLMVVGGRINGTAILASGPAILGAHYVATIGATLWRTSLVMVFLGLVVRLMFDVWPALRKQ